MSKYKSAREVAAIALGVDPSKLEYVSKDQTEHHEERRYAYENPMTGFREEIRVECVLRVPKWEAFPVEA